MSLGDELLAFCEPTDQFVHPVPCPELPDFDQKLYVRKVSAKELDDVAAKEESGNSRARYAVLFAAKADGTRLWRPEQAEKLGANTSLLWLVERINYAGRLHNGLTEENRRVVEKNSAPAAGNGSHCCSAAPSPPATDSTTSG
jgi:hypothetical protein